MALIRRNYFLFLLSATFHTQTLVAIGPGQICVPKKRTTNSNKNFPRGQVNDSADNLDFEKINKGDRLKINTADPSHF